jgi:hypothetical protein
LQKKQRHLQAMIIEIVATSEAKRTARFVQSWHRMPSDSGPAELPLATVAQKRSFRDQFVLDFKFNYVAGQMFFGSVPENR